MKRVLITAPYMVREHDKVEALFRKEFSTMPELEWVEVDERLNERQLNDLLNGFHGIICGDDEFTEDILDQADQLEVIVKWGTGIDSINKDYADSIGIPVKNTDDAFTVPVSETAIGLCLAFTRSIMKSDHLMKNGDWDKPQGYTLSELTVGLIGVGNIGFAVARKLHMLGANLLLNDIESVPSDLTNLFCVKPTTKAEIYENSDIISLHCDLNETSRHLLSKSEFNAMKATPWIINTARGSLIEEESLIEALQEGVISGVGLDVFEEEPLPSDSPLRSMDKAILSSHNSNSSQKYWDRVHRNSIRMLKQELTNG